MLSTIPTDTYISRTCIAGEHARATINVAKRGKARKYISYTTTAAAACLPACSPTGRIEC